MARVKFDRDLGAKLVEKIQPSLDAKLREIKDKLSAEVNEITRQVAREMSGRQAEQVLPELRTRILSVAPPGRLSLNDESMRAIAGRISDGTWPAG